MTRSSRLLDLLQLLRGYRQPVTAKALAKALEISPRTLYRDIASLMAMGAPVRGEAGVGYVLEPGFLLPPLMFTCEEIEALALGADYVASHTDYALSQAARNALTRIAAILPDGLRHRVENASLMTGPSERCAPSRVDPALLRQAIRDQSILVLGYKDGQGRLTQREIWPFAMAYFDKAQILVAWCALRATYRHFRLDRIETMSVTARRYTRTREALLREWEKARVVEDAQDADRN